jgi:DNA modification methylase
VKLSKKRNQLFYGDNLQILRDYVADESVDLVYLDPPFNSDQNFNVIFKERGGEKSASQQLVFKDTWKWNEKAEEVCRQLIEDGGRLSEAIRAMRTFLGSSNMMAYLVMMAPRLVELHRVLKPTGSIYLHCDPTASHYLKMLMDAVFGPANFHNEIIWKRTGAHSAARRWNDVHDTLLFYSKSSENTWNEVLTQHSDEYSARYKNVASDGRLWADDNLTGPGLRRGHSGGPWRGYDPTPRQAHWKVSRKAVETLVGKEEAAKLTTIQKLDLLDEHGLIHWPQRRGQDGAGFPRFKRMLSAGASIQDVITDIPPINSQAQERLGYPTQKPEALLERIIKASSNQGDVVLDPFCGCGTAVAAGQKLGRRWVGIDVTHLATAIIKQRLVSAFGFEVFRDIQVHGEPVTISEAEALARENKFGFQCWAVGRLGAPPIENRRGADRGIDGRIYFHDDAGAAKQIVISVKAGENIGPAYVRELRGVIEREQAEMGIFVCVKDPTSEMKREAANAGHYRSLGGIFPRLQIVTVNDIFADKPLNIPGRLNPYERKKPGRATHPIAEQLRLLP